MSENNEGGLADLLPLVGIGALVITVATAPVWLPMIFGVKPKKCECGTKLTPDGICPYCKCYY